MTDLAKLEDKFRAAKKAGKVTDKMKAELRAARQKFRESERSLLDGAVRPATINAEAGVHG